SQSEQPQPHAASVTKYDRITFSRFDGGPSFGTLPSEHSAGPLQFSVQPPRGGFRQEITVRAPARRLGLFRGNRIRQPAAGGAGHRRGPAGRRLLEEPGPDLPAGSRAGAELAGERGSLIQAGPILL